MKLLLDTHVFLWLDADDRWVADSVREICEDRANQVFLSIASVWEMQIKIALGKLKSPLPPAVLAEAYTKNATLGILPISLSHVHALTDLPRLHGDPFDRMLIAQARHEGLTLISEDGVMREDPVEVLWA